VASLDGDGARVFVARCIFPVELSATETGPGGGKRDGISVGTWPGEGKFAEGRKYFILL
jgi:hypothetical protein